MEYDLAYTAGRACRTGPAAVLFLVLILGHA